VIVASPELAAVLAALAVMSLALAGMAPSYQRRRELAARLSSAVATGTMAADLGGRRRGRGSVRLYRPSGRGLLGRLERRLERAGLDVSPAGVLGLSGLTATVGLLLGGLAQGIGGAAVGLGIGIAVVPLWIGRHGAQRQGRFRSQLPDSVAMLAASVRAGHSLAQAIEQVATDSPEPTRSALAQVVREIGVGSAQDEALTRLAQHFPSEELDLITSAMEVQHQVGGSLSRVLDDIAATLRERVRIEGDIKALTAQQRYSAYVLALLPVFVGIGLFLVSNDYAQLLLQGALRFAVAGAGLMVVLGFLIMRRMATIDV
jgi:tight adherence protein B